MRLTYNLNFYSLFSLDQHTLVIIYKIYLLTSFQKFVLSMFY